MRPSARPLFLAALLLAGCTNEPAPRYALGTSETGVFRSANAGKPIPLTQIKGMDERQLTATFGKPRLDRRDAATRTLRYASDACTLFVYLTNDRAQFADALDPQMRPLPPDACAGSVAAQKRDIG
ncbi:MAG: hypothetical protein J0J01_27105 [Reyranella sp.]|uniref:hypothetical protein n=1 Tax=Reyranella sp. TaxID=1929291 RepID=UPI001AC1A136|nr:hypothetical protein [Reyranella sp.]MBN9090597.1 hypothetical protein [Reyranella sp.]